MAVVTINPGDDIAAKINGSASGDTVVFNFTTFTEFRTTTQISPRANQILPGPGRALCRINASKLLSGWTGSSTTWQWSGTIPKPTTITNLPNTTPPLLHSQARFPGTLFRNKQVVWKAGVKDTDGTVYGDIASQAGLNPTGHTNGECFVDYQAGIVYYRGSAITGSDVMEFTNTHTIVGGSQAGWELYGVELFGSGNRGVQPTGANVKVHDIDVHGCWINAAMTSPGSRFHHNRCWDGLQYCVKGSGDNIEVDHNEFWNGDLIDFRNGDGGYYDSGLSKFTNCGTPGVANSGLYSHDNLWRNTTGHALWLDIDNINNRIINDTYRDIGGFGIHYEISYSGKITGCTFERCRQPVYISTSQDVDMQGCSARGSTEWIVRIVDDPNRPQTPPTTGWSPGGGAWPDHRGVRNKVRNKNDFWLDVPGVLIGISGWPADAATMTSTNQFDGNYYHLPTSGMVAFSRNGTTNFTGWRGKGQDTAASGARFFGPGTWTTSVPLVAGANTINVVATDVAGNQTTVTRSITRQTGADTTAPTLTISTPSSDLGVPSGQTTQSVVGSATDAGSGIARVTVNGTVQTLGGGGTFSTSVPLVVGSNPITATAVDGAGNTTTITRTITRANPPDTTPPTLTVSTPAADGTVANSATSQTVAGTVTDNVAVASLTVNGTAVARDGSGNFSTSVPIGIGSNTITIVATDTNANTTTVTRTILRPSSPTDTTPPTVQITDPATDVTLDVDLPYTLTVTVAATDDVAVTGVTVNGVAADITGDNYTANLTLTAEGATVLTAVALDAAGNRGTDTRTLTVRQVDLTPPQLTITTQTGTVTGSVGDLVRLNGTATDNVSVASVTVNGNPATVTGSAWTLELGLATLGPNVFTVVALDPAGNSTTASVTITLAEAPVADTTPPNLLVISPPSDIFISGTGGVAYPVQGFASDTGSGLASVTVNGLAISVDQTTGAFSTNVTLQSPTTSIVIIASDQAGNQMVLTRTITIANDPSVVSVSGDLLEMTTRMREAGF